MKLRRRSLPAMVHALFCGIAFLSVAHAGQSSAQVATDGAKSATPPADNTKAARVLVATVNNKPIYKDEIDRAVNAYVGNQTVDPAVVPTIQATFLKQRIENDLLNSFLMAQKEQVTQEDLKAAMNEIQNGLRAQNLSLETYLARQNTTREAFMSGIVGQLMVMKYAQANTTEEGLKKFFEDNKYLFDGSERRVSHVLLRPDGPADDAVYKAIMEQAKSLRDQIATGSIKFEDAAAKYSAGPSRQRGGDLGYVPIAGVMHPTFTKAVYDLKPDEVSEPVATPFGIHLIKVTGVKAGTKTFDEVKSLVQQAYSKYLISKLIEYQFNAANIVYAGNYPYFQKGTRDVVMPGQTPAP
jgi:peptidyl-prolyl cis-trans isomerase C